MRHIENKQEFYLLSRKLLLGNILIQWTWEQFLSQCQARVCDKPHELPLNGIVGVRHIRKAFTNKGNSGIMKIDDAIEYGTKTPDRENLLFDEGAIHDHLTIQGEVMADEKGLYVRYSNLQVHQRTLWHIDHFGVTGLKKHQLPHNINVLSKEQRQGKAPVVYHARGLQAVCLLKQYMDVMSWEKLSDLLSYQVENPNSEFNFDHPIIEFACFDCKIGVLKWNTLFWEVRTKY